MHTGGHPATAPAKPDQDRKNHRNPTRHSWKRAVALSLVWLAVATGGMVAISPQPWAAQAAPLSESAPGPGPAAPPDYDPLRAGGQVCAFGAAALGTSSLLVLYPILFSGYSTAPVLGIVLGNSLFGCGIALVGALAADGFGRLYDGLGGGEPATPASRPSGGQ